MKTAYFDCFSGASGDMFLGALVGAGLPVREIEKELHKLPIGGFHLKAKKVRRCGIRATKVDVVLDSGNSAGWNKARRWDDIHDIIRKSSLSGATKEKAEGIFTALFRAEAKVHGEPFRKVHLHELGAVDCLADICGTLAGLELLGIEKIYASPVNLGSGSVMTEHGLLPVPAPATAEILRGVPVYSSGEPFELTTPTGAVLLKSLVCEFGGMPFMTVESTGMGAGGREMESRPNILRVLTGKMHKAPNGEGVTVIETNIDDMNPQIYEDLVGRLFKKGALDVFMTQVIMKKMRPGVKLTVLCERAKRADLMKLVLSETTSIGVRWYEASRMTMEREMGEVLTRYGKVRVKISALGDSTRAVPEYEDCRKLAWKNRVPLIDVIEEAKRAAAGLVKKQRS